jgi:hypothetical protein
MSAMNAARVSVPRAIAARRASHVPVSSADASDASGICAIKLSPSGVATRWFRSRAMYSRRNNVSMIDARVAGVPRPVSFIAARSASSSMRRPAVSIAPSSVASVYRGGGVVCFACDAKVASSTWPSTSTGSAVVGSRSRPSASSSRPRPSIPRPSLPRPSGPRPSGPRPSPTRPMPLSSVPRVRIGSIPATSCQPATVRTRPRAR